MLVLFDAVIFIYGVYTVYSAVNMKQGNSAAGLPAERLFPPFGTKRDT